MKKKKKKITLVIKICRISGINDLEKRAQCFQKPFFLCFGHHLNLESFIHTGTCGSVFHSRRYIDDGHAGKFYIKSQAFVYGPRIIISISMTVNSTIAGLCV